MRPRHRSRCATARRPAAAPAGTSPATPSATPSAGPLAAGLAVVAGLAVLAAVPAAAALPVSARRTANVARPAAPSPVPVPVPATVRRSTATVWLCRPGMADDPCTADRSATAVLAGGARTGATLRIEPPRPGRFDCFYVYPTASDQPASNSDLAVQPAERAAAVLQASQFAPVCTVWAPMYRQATVGTVAAGLHPHSVSPALRRAEAVAYDSLLAAWRDFLARHDDRRPIVLIGHSQGAALLVRLIARQIDPRPALRARLVVAILAGGNLQVPRGRTVGATFRHVPLCTRSRQAGCAIAWSSFPSEPPAAAIFGRPGQGISLLAGQTRSRGQQVACVDPAALGGGTGTLRPYFLAAGAPLAPPVTTPWVTYPGLYSGRCEHRDGAAWLQVTVRAGPGDSRPAVGEPAGPAWGYHGDDVNLVLGNLVRDVAGEEAAWSAAHR